MQVDGYKMHKWDENSSSFPFVVTIFSAPNYCGTYKNRAAVLILKNSNLQMKQFSAVETPFNLPDGMDLFTWSLPFLSEKVNLMLNEILNNCTLAELRQNKNE